MKAVLDPNVPIWWLNDHERPPPAQQEVVGLASPETPPLASDISLLEVVTLHGLDRIPRSVPLREWLDKAAAPPPVRRHGIIRSRKARTNKWP